MICLELHLTCTWSWEINHRNINHLSVKHWAWGAVELSCSRFYIYLCTKAVLPRRVKESCLCMKFLSQTKLNYFSLGFWRFFFSRHFNRFYFAGFWFSILFFFQSTHTLLCTPCRSRRETVVVWQKYWPKLEVPESSRETFLRFEIQVCYFKLCARPE